MNRENTKFKKYNTKNKITYFLYFLSAICVFAFGLYYKEGFELGGGIFLFLRGLYLIKTNNKEKGSIIRNEKKGLSIKLLLVLAFSLINPIGTLPFLYEIKKRDWIINGGLDEEKK
ncbi:MAG: hypothetical protein E7C03_00405 [Anaerococcus sp.]|nr:hypothetical protein [Anaerococcus sp.]